MKSKPMSTELSIANSKNIIYNIEVLCFMGFEYNNLVNIIKSTTKDFYFRIKYYKETYEELRSNELQSPKFPLKEKNDFIVYELILNIIGILVFWKLEGKVVRNKNGDDVFSEFY